MSVRAWGQSFLLAVIAVTAALYMPARAAIRFDSPLLFQVPGDGDPVNHASFSVADLDHDGILDLAVPNAESLSVLLGRGDGTFAPPLGLATPGGAQFTSVADIDGDGALDIAFCNSDRAGVLFGDGTGTNWSRTDLVTAYCLSIAAGDFDGDGSPDIAVLTRDQLTPPHHMIRVFLSRPGRAFSAVTGIQDSIPEIVAAIRVADMNHDGRLDLVITNQDNRMVAVVFLGEGDGRFVAHAITETANLTASDLDVADVTGDGVPDIVVSERSRVVLFTGLGDGTFGAASEPFPPSYVPYYSVAVADMDGDGLLDLITADANGDLAMYAGIGGGIFGPAHHNNTLNPLNPIAVADVNGDERPDVVALSIDGDETVVALGDGLGHFGGRRVDIPLSESVGWITAGDFDGDGVPDLVVNMNSSVQTLLSRSGRTFISAAASPAGTCAEDPAVADFDEDGHLDLVFPVATGGLQMLLGQGNGAFAPPTLIAETGGLSASVAVDLNGDGHTDLVFGFNAAVRVLLGRGDGTFDAPVDSPLGAGLVPGGASGQLATGDFNGDHVLDIHLVAFNPGTHESFQMTMWGDGSGAFVAGVPGPLINFGWTGALAADLDSDGRSDVITTDACCPNLPRGPLAGVILAHLQQPDGTLGATFASRSPGVGSTGTIARDQRLADLDASQFPGIVYRFYDGFYVMTGDGTGHFEAENGYSGGGANGCALGDFDADGRLDVAMAMVTPYVSIYFGRDSEPPSVAILSPSAAAELSVGATVPIHWNATDDTGVQSLDLFVSRHGRSGPFERLALGLSNTGEFDWTVSAPFSDSVVFKLVARDAAGNVGKTMSTSPLRIVDVASVGGGVGYAPKLAISAIAPNPARNALAISFALPQAGRARLALFDLQGRKVARLMDEQRPAGNGTISWNLDAARLHAGLYFVRLDTAQAHVIGRLAVAQ